MKRSPLSLLIAAPWRGLCIALTLAGALPLGATAQAMPLLPGVALITPAPLVVAADNEDPNMDPDYLYQRALASQTYRKPDNSNYKEAINLYNQALKRRNNFSDAIFNKAVCNYYLKRYDESIKDSTKHIEIRPNIMQAYVVRARAYLLKKSYQPAIADLDTVERKRPDLMDYRLRGKIYLGLENYQKAIPDFEQYLARYKNQAEAIPVFLDLGDVYAKTNQPEKAVESYGNYIVNYDNMIQRLPEVRGDEELDNLPYALDKRGTALLDMARKDDDPASPRLDTAENDYKKYVEVKPDSPVGYVGLGNVYILRKEADKAIEVLNKALTKDPENESAKFAIGRLERGEAQVAAASSRTVEARGNMQSAITRFSEVLNKNPKNAAAYYERGLAYSSPQVGDYASAAADFTQYLANAPANDANINTAYFNRGVAYVNMNPPQYDKAIPDFNAAIQADPKNMAAYIGRGDAYAKQAMYDQAVADYNTVINSGDEVDASIKIAAHYNRAVSYSKMQPPRTEEAIADLNTYLQVNGDNKPAKDLLFELQLSQGPEKQLAALTKRITEEPSVADNYLLRASVYDTLKQYDNAIDDYEKVTALKPDEIKAYQNLAADYTAKGLDNTANSDGAIAAYTKLIALAPTDAKYVLARGDLYLNRKQYAEAAADYKKAVATLPANDPSRTDIQYKVASLYLASGNKAAAKTELDSYFATAQPNSPSYTEALAVRGDLLRADKNYAGAIADYTKYLAAKPGDIKVLKVRGQSYLDSGDATKALADFDAAVAAAPSDAESLTLAASLYYNQGKKQAEVDPEKAVPLYKKTIEYTNKAITSDSSLAGAYYYKGLAAIDDAEIDNLTPDQQKAMRTEALAALNKFVELAPGDAQAATAKTLIAKLKKALGS